MKTPGLAGMYIDPLDRIEMGMSSLRYLQGNWKNFQRISDVVHANPDIFDGVVGDDVFERAAAFLEVTVGAIAANRKNAAFGGAK
jgi:hypothetical protein